MFCQICDFCVLGVPYAKPPVGSSRFVKPEPYGQFRELNATTFGSACPQILNGVAVGDEDCLTLNIYTPKSDAAKVNIIKVFQQHFAV